MSILNHRTAIRAGVIIPAVLAAGAAASAPANASEVDMRGIHLMGESAGEASYRGPFLMDETGSEANMRGIHLMGESASENAFPGPFLMGPTKSPTGYLDAASGYLDSANVWTQYSTGGANSQYYSG